MVNLFWICVTLTKFAIYKKQCHYYTLIVCPKIVLSDGTTVGLLFIQFVFKALSSSHLSKENIAVLFVSVVSS